MGLDDIDEDLPPPPPNRGETSGANLSELFEGLGVTVTKSAPARAQQQQQQQQQTSDRNSDALDELLLGCGASPTTQHPPRAPPVTRQTNDVDVFFSQQSQPAPESLLDFSAPVQRKQHHTANDFLEGFVQGRSPSATTPPPIAQLSSPSSTVPITSPHILALMNYYDVLGVARTATVDELKAAYKKKALHLHPDKASQRGIIQSKNEVQLFKIMTQAYEVLSNPLLRAEYDVAESKKEAQAAANANWMSHLA